MGDHGRHTGKEKKNETVKVRDRERVKEEVGEEERIPSECSVSHMLCI